MKAETKTPTKASVPSPVPSPAARRNFLLGATLASAGAVAAVVTAGNSGESAETPVIEGKTAKPRGYHLTPHIAQYYETTKL
jgi:hypothetical protein